jgi:hypothetical protein
VTSEDRRILQYKPKHMEPSFTDGSAGVLIVSQPIHARIHEGVAGEGGLHRAGVDIHTRGACKILRGGVAPGCDMSSRRQCWAIQPLTSQCQAPVCALIAPLHAPVNLHRLPDPRM